MNAVRWKTTPLNIAALVTDHSTTHLNAELYHFDESPRPMGAELYLLEKGNYTWNLIADHRAVSIGEFEVNTPRTSITFNLPPQRLCVLQIIKKAPPTQKVTGSK